MVYTVVRPKKAKKAAYGEGVTKKPFQFMLTTPTSEVIDRAADDLGITRSELLERVVRCGGIEAVLECLKKIGANND